MDGFKWVSSMETYQPARGFLEGQNWQLATQPVLRSFQRRHRRSYRGSWQRRLMSHKEWPWDHSGFSMSALGCPGQEK
jgi:hypothetical protein